MASKEVEAHYAAKEKYKEVKKELKDLKVAIEKSEKTLKTKAKSGEIYHTIEQKDLFIERKDRRKQLSDDTFDTSPGDHVLVEL